MPSTALRALERAECIFSWSKGEIPTDAIAVGNDTNGHTVYVGKVIADGQTIFPAAVVPSQNYFYEKLDSKPRQMDEYEVMRGEAAIWKSYKEEKPAGAVVFTEDELPDNPICLGRINHFVVLVMIGHYCAKYLDGEFHENFPSDCEILCA